MSSHRASFRKTVIVAVALTLLGAAGLAVSAFFWSRGLSHGHTVQVIGSIVASLATGAIAALGGLVTAGGLIALRRDSLEAAGIPYTHTGPRESYGVAWSGRLIAGLRRLFPSQPGTLHLRPGEWVEVRPLHEIFATLDAEGRLDGVPFMPEMARWCNKRARVARRVDKLNDWINGTGLKRMGALVHLEDIRCDGSSHGGCQANCHLRWREAWLKRAGDTAGNSSARTDGAINGDELSRLERLARRPSDTADVVRYMCQATELTTGGKPIRRGDLSHYLRDLLTGNVRPSLFLTGIAIASFNWFQRLRQGTEYPYYEWGTTPTSPHEVLDLQVGERVRVKPKHLIGPTLNNRRRNRGLWFDGEMLRFCGGEYQVKIRVARSIVEKTGELRVMTNACIILEGVIATGEYLGFNPENEHIFWREIWLERVGSPAQRSHALAASEANA